MATAASYAVSPQALGGAGSDPARSADHLSAGYLIALAGRMVREVGAAGPARRPPGEAAGHAGHRHRDRLRRRPSSRAAFADELTAAVTDLAARYHDPGADGARPHRLVVGAHPIPRPEEDA